MQDIGISQGDREEYEEKKIHKQASNQIARYLSWVISV
jgi:hypothetical protein